MAAPVPVAHAGIEGEEGGGAGRRKSGGGASSTYNNYYYGNYNRSSGSRAAPSTSSFDSNLVIVTCSLFAVLLLALFMHFAIRWALSYFFHVTSPHAGSPHSTGLHKAHFDSLPTKLYSQNADMALIVDATSSSSSQCPICLSDFADGDRIRVLPICQHDFHVICIDTWLAKHTSCPTCRRNLMDALPKEAQPSHMRLHILIAPTLP